MASSAVVEAKWELEPCVRPVITTHDAWNEHSQDYWLELRRLVDDAAEEPAA
jgi:hypothetical protein